jgi:hypothetical protein
MMVPISPLDMPSSSLARETGSTRRLSPSDAPSLQRKHAAEARLLCET